MLQQLSAALDALDGGLERLAPAHLQGQAALVQLRRPSLHHLEV